MDRSRTKEFQEFTLLLEGCLRAYARNLSKEPPRNPIGEALYRAFPFAQSLLGRPGPVGVLFGLDAETVSAALAGGSVPPSVSDFRTVKPSSSDPGSNHYDGGLRDSARILGRIEKSHKREIPDMFADWLAAERRRDTDGSRKLFVDAVVRRVLGITSDPMSGAQSPRIEPDAWWYQILEETESARFAEAVADVFTTSGIAADPGYPDAERFTDLLLGARLCGHVEGLAGMPMREIIVGFNRDANSDSIANLTEIFARAIAKSALDADHPWTSSTEAILPGLHEHLKLMKAERERDLPPSVAM